MRLAILALVFVAGCQESDVSRTLGARCDLSSECDDRCLPPSAGWPGGFCTVTCDSDDDCPGISVCIEDNGAVCAYSCETDPGCEFLGSGYFCRDVPAHGTIASVKACKG